MRILTKREIEAFESAWLFMERVGGLYASNGEAERDVERVVVMRKDGSTESLPPKVIAMVKRLGGLRATNALFNGMTKKTHFEKFINALMSRREQPRDYWADGTLFYDDGGHATKNGVEIVYEEAA